MSEKISNSPNKIKRKRRTLMRKHIKDAQAKINDLNSKIKFWERKLFNNSNSNALKEKR